MVDSENSIPICGYPRLAKDMEGASSIAMVRTFTALNNESLLYFQAQLVVLERELRGIQKRDARPQVPTGVDPDPDPRCSTDWEWLGVYSPGCEQWQKVLEIRKVLKEYSRCKFAPLMSPFYSSILDKAILRQVKLSSLKAPPEYDLEDIQSRFEKSRKDASNPLGLMGVDRSVWGSKIQNEKAEPAKDLVALNPRPESDPFSALVMEKCTPWLYPRLRKLNETVFVNDRKQLRYTAMVTTVVASLLPIASIAILYSNKSIKARLALIAIFTFLFASSLVCFSTAKRTEVFSATAA
ncbi:MAG: hypothetical protein Q9160_008890 [Pyrenula sp. 1 TL-2023]